VAVKYTTTAAAKIILASERYVVDLEQEKLNKQKYDKPCSKYDTAESKGLFLLFVSGNLDLFDNDEDKNTVLSRLSRWASNGVLPSTVSDSDASTYLATSDGAHLIASIT
jgi:hypothetical protein